MPKNPKFASTLYNSDFLRQRYVVDDLNASQIAKEVGCGPSAVLDALERFGIPKKTMSEVIAKVDHPGSRVSRPRAKLKLTLHNAEWMAARAHLNASELAREAGCSVPAAQAAMHRQGRTPPSVSEAKAGRANPARMVPDEHAALVTFRARARTHIPEQSCQVCGRPGPRLDINHKDRNPRNNAPENLERLCRGCHARQHSVELRVMIEALAREGVPYILIHDEARRGIRTGTEPRGAYAVERRPERLPAPEIDVASNVPVDPGVGPNSSRRLPDEYASIAAHRKRARTKTPQGPCNLCGVDGPQVNHKDRNPRNNDPSNLERVCQACHSRQHAAELWVMVALLPTYGLSYIQIHDEARRRIHPDGSQLPFEADE